MFKKLIPYLCNGFKSSYADLWLLISDFLIASLVPYGVQFALWYYLYHDSRHAPMFYSFMSLMGYYAYVITVNRLNNGYEIIERISEDAHGGHLVAFQCKPLHFILQRLAEFIGGGVLYFVFFYICFFTFNLLAKTSLDQLLVSLLGASFLLILSQFLCFYISASFAIFSIKTLSPNFLLSLLLFCQTTFGGVLLPWSFWPKWLQLVMHVNPFWFVIAGPASVLTHFSLHTFLFTFIGLCFYLIFFVGLIHIFLYKILQNQQSIGG